MKNSYTKTASKRWKLSSIWPHSPYEGSVTPHVLIPLICVLEAQFHRRLSGAGVGIPPEAQRRLQRLGKLIT